MFFKLLFLYPNIQFDATNRVVTDMLKGGMFDMKVESCHEGGILRNGWISTEFYLFFFCSTNKDTKISQKMDFYQAQDLIYIIKISSEIHLGIEWEHFINDRHNVEFSSLL